MNKIAIAFGLSLAATILLWMSVDTLSPVPLTHMAYKHAFVQLTGVIAIVTMSLCMITSLRLSLINRLVGGLDKTYRLHKWFGVASFIFSVIHWLAGDIASKIVPLKEIGKRARHQHGESGHFIIDFFHQNRVLAEVVGEYGFYALVAFVFIALARFIPYHIFRKAHHVIAIIFLSLVFHSVLLTKGQYWATPFGVIYGLIMLLGTIAAVMSLMGKIGHGNKAPGRITHIVKHPDIDVVEATVVVDEHWQGHKPGQFAFLTSKRAEGAHPYTIASSWNAESRELTFIIKALGDWTSQLKDWFKIDMPVTVEGPYGQFNFSDSPNNQVWIGAGIGSTPFIAKLKELEQTPSQAPISLFVCADHVSDELRQRLEARASMAGVTVHWYLDSEGKRLSAELISQSVGSLNDTSVWFCGPEKFGKILKKGLIKKGLSRLHFHQEMFKFR
ncbi:ferredoxin reductase family protein [Vibrio astriarenae]